MNLQAKSFKLLPSIDKLLQSKELKPLINRVGQDAVKSESRSQLDSLRTAIANNDERILKRLTEDKFLEALCVTIKANVESEFAGSLLPVFNLTGTVLHTNLGRARLPQKAISAMQVIASEAVNLEYDLTAGTRGDRDSHIEETLCNITGAEAATIVNNNAAAVLLVLNTLAEKKEVVVSRGELVEIGGSFRIPDVMKSANCELKEIGTTNRTHLRDYEAAVNKNTAVFMKVHTSNYEIKGFVNSVSESELGGLAKKHNLPFVSDLGSGTLIDLTRFNLPREITVQESIQMGADIVTFSGDKLLGGPQAGIIVGKANLISKIKSNPLKRALRIDKITLAGLKEVINLYRDSSRLQKRLPLLQDLTRPIEDIQNLAIQLLPSLRRVLSDRATIEVRPCLSQIGSGALPLSLLPSVALEITPVAEKGQTDAALSNLSHAFRKLSKPVIGRIHDGKLIFDLRCLQDKKEFEAQLVELHLS